MAIGPWSVKGIDPRAREVAKAAAQREGLTLGEWMNQRLLGVTTPPATTPPAHERARFTAPGSLSILSDAEPESGSQDALAELAARLEAAERRSTLAISGIDQTVLGLLTRLEGVEKNHNVTNAHVEQNLAALESAVTRSGADLEQTLRKLDRASEDSAQRIDTVAERTEVQLARARQELSRELELVNNRSDELSQRLGAAERMTDNAVRTLEASFAAVDDRLRLAEKSVQDNSTEGLSETFARRFKALGEELIQVVAQTRGQLASQIEAQAAGPRLNQFESSLSEMRQRMADTERRHAETLERIAGEVGKMGGAIEHRLSDSERRISSGLDQLLDARFRNFQHDHAAAIDKIGDGLTGAISRLEDKIGTLEAGRQKEQDLDTRLAAAEARTATLIEDALTRLKNDSHNEKADPAAADSPVQNALKTLATRLEALEGRADSPPPFDPAHWAGEVLSAHEPEAVDEDVLEEILTPPPVEEPDGVGHASLEEILTPPTAPQAETEAAPPPSLPPLPPVSAEAAPEPLPEAPGTPGAPAAISDSLDFSALPVPDIMAGTGFEDLSAPIAPAPAPAGATADFGFIAAARHSMRQNSAGQQKRGVKKTNGQGHKKRSAGNTLLMVASFVSISAILGAGALTLLDIGKDRQETKSKAVSTASIDWDAVQNGPTPAAAQEETGSAKPDSATPLAGASLAPVHRAPKPARRAAPARPHTAPAPTRLASTVKPEPRTAAASASARPRPHPATPVTTLALNAPPTAPRTNSISMVTPKPANQGRLSIREAADSGDPVAQFQLASAKLDAGDSKTGLTLMRKAADHGLPIAQYRLGKIYEDGALITKDEAQARRWTERAANGGNRRAMHNLAMIYAEGKGIKQSYATAAKWFQQAAWMGLTNSQYNLAYLYEQGLGVPESPADAYAWYAIAAKAGDKGAKKHVTDLAPGLSATAKKQAQSIIAQFRPRPLDLAANGIFTNVAWARPQLNTAPTIARAQTLLARIGYKPGPANGNPGATTRQAVIAYERDHGLAQTGRIDATLLARLENTAVN